MSYTVTRRTREIGIRIALGAGRGEVLGLVLREIAILTGIGIAIAAPLSFPLVGLAKSMLFGVAPDNMWVLVSAAAVLALTALASGAVPALRAVRVDPLSALRND
jgi:ABC-type antimicrobial peptide transport system permease subunit